MYNGYMSVSSEEEAIESLAYYTSIKVPVVEIIAPPFGDVCPVCHADDGTKYMVEIARLRQPLPHKGCTCERGCMCCYCPCPVQSDSPSLD